VPYRVRKQDCAKTDGGSGTHVVQKKSGGKWSKASCHSGEEKAKSAIRARGMNEDDEASVEEGRKTSLTARQIRKIIREEMGVSYLFRKKTRSRFIKSTLFSEGLAVATASDVSRFKTEILDWAEVLVDEMADRFPKMKEISEKVRTHLIEKLTKVISVELVGLLGHMTSTRERELEKEREQKSHQKWDTERKARSGRVKYIGKFGI
jgi:hypothetical protein